MNFKIASLTMCAVLAGCAGEEGGSNVEESTVSQTTLTEQSLLSATKSVSANETLTELVVNDDLDDDEIIQKTLSDPSAPLVNLKSAVGAYDVGGYACNVVSNPDATFKWSINLYNLNDSLQNERVIFGVTNNRNIQSVACTPDGSHALFSIREFARGDYEVYSINLLTNEVTQLTDNDTDDVDVSMSVDGLVMAWQERLPDDRQGITIRTYNANKTSFTQKGIASAVPFVQPSLSPNGEWMALVQLRPSRFLALRYDVKNGGFSEIRAIARRKKLYHPSVSDDGNIFSWVENAKQNRFFIKNIAANVLTEFFNHEEGTEHPVLSFDGQWVSYSINSSDVAKTYLTNISTGETSTIGAELSSPGRYLATSWMGTIIIPQVLALDVPSGTMLESGSAMLATVTRSGPLVEPLVVSLSSSDTSELKVPATLTFGVGETSKSFYLTPVDDDEIDGTQQVIVSASAVGADTVTTEVGVEDDGEILDELSIVLSKTSISESGGKTTATVSRTGPTDTAIVVTLTSSSVSDASVPDSITIPAGATSASFNVTAVQDLANDGDQTVVIEASANGLTTGIVSLTVKDVPVSEVEETQVSLDSNGNVSIYDIGDTSTAENFNITKQTVDGVDFLQIQGLNGNNIQINQLGDDAAYLNSRTQTVVRIPLAVVKSLKIDTKGGADVINMRASLDLSGGMSLSADTINLLAAEISTESGNLSLTANKEIIMSGSQLRTASGKIDLSANMNGDTCVGSDGASIGLNLLNSSSITTEAGDVSVKGCGGTSGSKNIGVLLSDSGGQIQATGSGNISVVGRAGNGEANNTGVLVQGAQSAILSEAGSLDIQGYGSLSSSGDFNQGVSLTDGGSITSNATPSQVKENRVTIEVVGVGGKSTNNSNHGISISKLGRIHSESAELAVNGVTAGNNLDSNDSTGVYMNSDGELSSTSGAITVEADTIKVLATKITTVDSDLSVFASRSVVLSGGGLATKGGDLLVRANTSMSTTSLDLSGSSCSGGQGNFIGVDLVSTSYISSATGDIRVAGCGGASGDTNVGVRLGSTGGKIFSTGSGSVSIAGLAGQGGELNVGLLVQGEQSLIRSASGSIDMYGAGSSLSTGDFNPGVAVQNGGSIVSAATEQQVVANNAYARVSGVGGISHNDDNHGVIVNGDGSRIHSVAANLDVKGFTRGSNFGSVTSVGIDLNNSGEVSSDKGDITIEGGTVNILATSVSTTTSNLTVLATRNLLLSGGSLSTETGRLQVAANVDTAGTPEDITDDVCSGTNGNFVGVEMLSGSSIKSVDGSVLVSGCGGSSGRANIGLRLAITGGTIATTGVGSVWAKGIAGKGTNNNIGVTVKGADSAISTVNGGMTVIGYGSSGSTGEFNPGLAVQELGTISSTGSNFVNLIGVGGNSPKADNHGVIISGLGSKVSTSNSLLSISGTGGGALSNPGSNVGFYVNGGATVQSTGVGAISINGSGGLGLHNNDGVRIGGETDEGDNAEVISNLGTITIRGTASNQTQGDGNKGVRVNAGGKVTALSDAKINIYGMAGAGGSTNQGIQVAGDIKAESNALISAVNGDIVLTGNANESGTGDGNTGVNIMNYGFVETSGAGSITVAGTGGYGGLNHYGVGLYNGGEIRTTGTGEINIEGTGGTGNLGNSGVRLAGQLPEENPNKLPLLFAKISSAHGNINIEAQAGPGDGGVAPTTSPWDQEDHGMQGLYLTHGGWIEALGTASINIIATGGDGYNETNGVFIEGEDTVESEASGHEKGLESFITAVDGDINIEGYGNANNAVGNSLGVALLFAQINATGSGDIKIKGVGGSGNKRPTHGIQINQIGSQISSYNGSIDLLGIGGVGTANGNVGVKLVDGGKVAVLGPNPDATINIDGTGGYKGRSANHGVQVGNGSGSTDLTSIEAMNGDATVVGVAAGTGLGDSNFGISLSGTTAGGGGQIISHGSAKLYVVGTGGSGVNSNGGVQIALGESKVSSTVGNIEIIGVASNDSVGEANAGVLIQTGGKIESNGSADILVNGTGGMGTINEGVVIMDEGAAISSKDGEIIVTAIGGDQAEDIRFYDPTENADNYIGGPEASGNITLNIDTINSVLGSIQSTGKLFIKPRTSGLSIGLAAGADDGTLNFGASELTSLMDGFSNITIGSEKAGQITLGALVSNDPMVLVGSNIQGLTTSPVHIDMLDDTTMTLSGQVSPKRDTSGRSVGQLVTSGRLKLASNANLLMRFRGLNPGNAYDQIIVNGLVNLNSAALDVAFFNGFMPQPGDVFVIVSNDGTDPVAGTFAGLSEGSTMDVSGIPLKISYVGGDGNDVQLSY